MKRAEACRSSSVDRGILAGAANGAHASSARTEFTGKCAVPQGMILAAFQQLFLSHVNPLAIQPTQTRHPTTKPGTARCYLKQAEFQQPRDTGIRMRTDTHNVISLSAYRVRSDETSRDDDNQRATSSVLGAVIWPPVAILALVGLICAGSVSLLP